MSKYWLPIILVTLLVLLLAACWVSESPAPSLAPTSEGEETQVENAAEVEEGEPPAAPEIDPEAIFAARCARCHGADRSGGRGPALLPERLTLDATVYQATITNGSGPMPSFSDLLSADEITAMAEFILSDPQ